MHLRLAAALLGGLLGFGCTAANPVFLDDEIDAGGTGADLAPSPDAGAKPPPPSVEAGPADRAIEVVAPPPVDAGGPEPAQMGTKPPAPPTTPQVADLLGYWPLDEASGTTAADFSGHLRHGTIGGGNLGVAPVPAGRVGGALGFPGGTSAEIGVQIPYSAALDGLRAFTIAAWFKLASAPPAGTHYSVLSRQLNATTGEIFNITCNGGAVIAYIPAAPGGGGQVTYEARARDVLSVGAWMHAAVTYDGRWLRLYLNGALTASSDFPNRLVSSPNTPMFIGTNKNASKSEPFHGVIDEVVLYGVAVPATTIGKLAMGQSPLDLR